MRMLVCLVFVVGCQHEDSAEHSAEITSQVTPAVTAAPAPAAAIAPTTLPQEHSCGCAGGGTCGGQCGGQCGGGEAPMWAPVPDHTAWTALHVTGMHCGGCARRIERALAGVDGVLAVKVDLKSAKVEVAVAAGKDARQLAAPVIDGLGYHVD